jgi:RimJ/RimL family protein N-acetyltransferase
MRETRARPIVLAMLTSHSHTHRYIQPVPAQTHQTPTDAAAATKGTRFSLRPLRAGDREALRTLFARLSPESRRRRFLTGKTKLSVRELTYLTDVDHVHHEALAAIDSKDGSIVGVARYVRWPERAGAADTAIEVVDDLHRNGIGLMLTEALIRRARENGIDVLTATTLWENHAARVLARRVGFRARSSTGSDVDLELQLADRAEHNTVISRSDFGQRLRRTAGAGE